MNVMKCRVAFLKFSDHTGLLVFFSSGIPRDILQSHGNFRSKKKNHTMVPPNPYGNSGQSAQTMKTRKTSWLKLKRQACSSLVLGAALPKSLKFNIITRVSAVIVPSDYQKRKRSANST